MLACVIGRSDLALDTPLAKTARDDDAVEVIELGRRQSAG